MLRRIERCLAQSDPQLERLFWIFTRLAGGERLPRTERVGVLPLARLVRHCRLARAAHGRVHAGTSLRSPLIVAVTLVMMCALVVAIGLAHGTTGPCSPPVQHIAQAHRRPCPAPWRWPAGR